MEFDKNSISSVKDALEHVVRNLSLEEQNKVGKKLLVGDRESSVMKKARYLFLRLEHLKRQNTKAPEMYGPGRPISDHPV